MEDHVFFHKGIGFESRSALQPPGSLKVADNISFEIDGDQTTRIPFEAKNAVAIGAVHSAKRYESFALVGHGGSLSRAPIATGVFTLLSAGFAVNAPWTFREYKKFLHAVNGTDGVLFDADGNLFPSIVPNPVTAVTGAAGAAGNPSGIYKLYVSFHVTYPNGHTYETGLSPVSDNVSVTNQKITWTIPVSTYAAYSIGATPLVIKRRLYRGPGDGGTLADIYWVADVADNTTTAYTDDLTDASLAAQGACTVTDYGEMPATDLIEYHYGILCGVNRAYPWRIYYTEPAEGDTAEDNENILPLATLQDNWDDIRVVGIEKVDIQSILAWGTYFFVGLKQGWIKRQGNDADTWSYKKTYAKHGVSAKRTVSISRVGIVYLSTNIASDCGLALFDGNTSTIFSSPKLDKIFKEDLAYDTADESVGTIAGGYYHLLYKDNAGAWKWLAVDLRRYPDIRAAYWEQVCGAADARCIDAYSQGYDLDNLMSIIVGGSDGKVYFDSTTPAAIPFEIWSKDSIGAVQIANKEKTLKEILYNIDTGGEEVTLELYIDGVKATWADGATSRTISGSSDSVKQLRDMPPSFKGRHFSLRVYDAVGHPTIHIYSPWTLVYDGKE